MRLLGLVAYLERNPGVRVDLVAQHFGTTSEQVLRDVDTLWMTGTPGYWPDDLIDFDADSLDSGVLRLTQSRGMTRALRLGTREAVTLIAALRALHESVGTVLEPAEREVLLSTLEVLTDATGEAAAAVDVQLSFSAAPEVAGTLRAALRDGRRVRIRYVDAADHATEREVDPWQILTGDERSYLQAWCHAVGGERLFRLDRVLEAQVLPSPVTHRRDDAAAGAPATFRPRADHDRVVIELDGAARWVAEQLPVEETVDLPDGGFRVALRVGSTAWLHHLLLRVAEHVRAVEPPELADDVARSARAALEHYR